VLECRRGHGEIDIVLIVAIARENRALHRHR
jgi:hypothetical protein